MNTRLDPGRISANFRFQFYIDEELNKVKILLSLDKQGKFNVDVVADIGWIYLEAGKNDFAQSYAKQTLHQASQLEQSQAEFLQNNQVIAIAHYVLATIKRENNNCQDAIQEYGIAQSLAQSDNLKSNIFRDLGLTYLKMEVFETAATIFKQGVDFLKQGSQIALKGSLPSLSNYYGLSKTRGALNNKQDPSEGLKILEETSQLYKDIFSERNISEADQYASHDFQSHQFHRGMILCEMAEQENKSTVQDKFQNAEKLLLNALQARIVNKADEQRLGDVCHWLGRIYVGLAQTGNAQLYFEKALAYYQTAFSNISNTRQIKEVQDQLAQLAAKEEPSLLRSHSILRAPSTSIPNSSSVLQEEKYTHPTF